MSDLRLKTPFSMIVASPSKSGKSTLVCKLLGRSKSYFDVPPSRVVYFYNMWSPTFNEWEDKIEDLEFAKGMCSREWIEENCSTEQNVTIVLDDQAMNITKDISEIFAVASHQYRINFIFLAQNLFTKNRFFRDASINATYIVIGKNPRDQSSIRYLAQQMLPSRSREILDAYTIATAQPYSHLLLDFGQSIPEYLRLRSNILGEGRPMSVYIKK